MILHNDHFHEKLLLLIFLFISHLTFAQNVGINTNGNPPDQSAILDLSATDKGLLIPRMDSTQRKNINNPAIGLTVYDSTYNSLMFYNGTAWGKLQGAADNLGIHTADQNIQLKGHFLSQDGSKKGVLIDTLGRVGIMDRTIDSTAEIKGKFYIQPVPIRSTLFNYPTGNLFIFNPFWQSFTPTVSGAGGIYELEIIFGAPTGTSNYELYAGEGTGGTLLYSGTISNSTAYTFGNVAFQAGQIYTLNILTLANSGGVYTQHSTNPLANGRISEDPNRDVAGSFSLLTYEPGFQVHDTAFITNNYRFPVVDGAANQILVLDNTGKLNWQDQINTDQQNLSISGNTLSLTNDATPVDMSGFMDNTDNQDFSLSNDSLYLSNDATPVDLSPYITNVDQQDLSLSGHILSLTNDPTTVDLSQLPGVDTQDLSFSNDTLFVTNDATPVSLKAFLDADTLGNHTATQNIQLNSHWLSGDGGNEGLQIDNNGQVGLGTATPQAPFHVELNAAQPGFRVTDTALIVNDYRIPLTDGSANQVLTTDGAGKLSWTDQFNTDQQDLALSGNTLSLSNDATTVDLGPYLDNTDNQDLSLNMDSLSLTNDATKIDLSPYHNTDQQDLSFSNDSLFLTGDASPVSLKAYRQDLSLSNDSLFLTNDATPVDLRAYRQDLSFANDSLFLTQSNPVDLRVFKQDLYFSNDSIYVSGQPSGIDLSGYHNTDNQDLSLSGNILNLTNDGTSVDMAAFPIVDDQQLSLSNDTLYLSNDPTPVYIGQYKDADSMGNHIANQNLRLNNQWLSGDGNDEGIFVRSNGWVGVGVKPNYPFQVGMVGSTQSHIDINLIGLGNMTITQPSIWQTFLCTQEGELNTIEFSPSNVVAQSYNYELRADVVGGTLIASGTTSSTSITFSGVQLNRGRRYYLLVSIPAGNSMQFSSNSVYPDGVLLNSTINDLIFKVTLTVQVGFLLQNHTFGIGRIPSLFHNGIEVEGNASKTVAGAWLANSDARLKKNIIPLDQQNTLQQMLSLKGVTYEWNDTQTGSKRPEEIQYGFIAQNIQEAFPTLVSTDGLGFLQTSYGTLDAMKVEAMRALNDRIKKLESQNAALQTQLDHQDVDTVRLTQIKTQLDTELALLEKEMAELQAQTER